jgi:hypothetical protein
MEGAKFGTISHLSTKQADILHSVEKANNKMHTKMHQQAIPDVATNTHAG